MTLGVIPAPCSCSNAASAACHCSLVVHADEGAVSTRLGGVWRCVGLTDRKNLLL